MGISFLTALAIRSNGDDIHCEACREQEKNAKWEGMISLYRDGHLHTVLLTSKPIYKSSRAAVSAMKKVVTQVRAAELPPPKKQ